MDRVPGVLKDDLIRYIAEVRTLYGRDRKENLNGLSLPGGLEKKYPDARREYGYDIRTIQELLGHQNLQTTMIYTHVASKNILGVRSPLDK